MSRNETFHFPLHEENTWQVIQIIWVLLPTTCDAILEGIVLKVVIKVTIPTACDYIFRLLLSIILK